MANGFWYDGHAKAHRLFIRPGNKCAAATEAAHRAASIGDLIHPNHPEDSPGQDYYFVAVKPQ